MTEKFEEVCEIKFREQNLRITRARTLLFRLLSQSSKPQTPQQIHHDLLSQKVGRVDLASVYRNLQVLKDLHLVHQVHPSGGYVACDKTHVHLNHAAEDHHHVFLICQKCEASQELGIPSRTLSRLESYVDRRSNFVRQEVSLVFRGLCENCST